MSEITIEFEEDEQQYTVPPIRIQLHVSLKTVVDYFQRQVIAVGNEDVMPANALDNAMAQMMHTQRFELDRLMIAHIEQAIRETLQQQLPPEVIRVVFFPEQIVHLFNRVTSIIGAFVLQASQEWSLPITVRQIENEFPIEGLCERFNRLTGNLADTILFLRHEITAFETAQLQRTEPHIPEAINVEIDQVFNQHLSTLRTNVSLEKAAVLAVLVKLDVDVAEAISKLHQEEVMVKAVIAERALGVVVLPSCYDMI